MSNVIGIGGSSHDFSVCLIKDGRLLSGIEEERLIKKRYSFDASFNNSLAYCLETNRLKPMECLFYSNDMIDRNLFSLSGIENPVFIGHHLAHAYGAFYPSKFREAAILVVDGCGSITKPGKFAHLRETTSYYYGDPTEIIYVSRIEGERPGASNTNPVDCFTSDSIGDLYDTVTNILGFGLLQAGKVMALASYGDNKFNNLFGDYIHILSHGQFRINLRWEDGLIGNLKKLISQCPNPDHLFKLKADIAFSCQYWLEKLMLHSLEFLYSTTKSKNLCISGGVALNCVFNGKITSLTGFSNVYIPFAPNDSGTAFGAAIFGHMEQVKIKKHFRLSPYLGKKYNSQYVRKSLLKAKSQITYSKSNNVCKEIAQELNNGMIVGWFQGGSEFGPRALGNRSILASPFQFGMKDKLNIRVKHRENFRPFAPAVLSEKVLELFGSNVDSAYMQFNMSVKQDMRHNIIEASHIDGTARLQTIAKRENPIFYKLVKYFYELSGVPAVLNTSFNIYGQPIVESPEDAIAAFLETDFDILVIHNYIIRKRVLLTNS